MGKGRITPQSEIFCKLIAENKMGQTEAYLEAYPKAKQWGKGVAPVAACNLAKKPHIQARIEELRALYSQELARRYVWNKQRATEVLVKAIERVENNLALIDETKQKMEEKNNSPSSILSTVAFQTNSAARTLKEVAQELNNLYGLTKTNINIEGGLKQVIFEGEDKLPPDEEFVDNNGNEVNNDQ